MVPDYPITRADLLTVLRPLRAASHFVGKIVDFLELDLTDGFPIRLGTCQREVCCKRCQGSRGVL